MAEILASERSGRFFIIRLQHQRRKGDFSQIENPPALPLSERWMEKLAHYKISREKFEPEPGFEPRTSGFLARRSTNPAENIYENNQRIPDTTLFSIFRLYIFIFN